ncbi:glycosyltransferase family 2 protein [Flavobacteriaceae bacterium 14752]|uniref:glycosyltransferase family 2 protein n=1 Tax=Mesohalobacter salilacus TaxID=2491711 RepID=UPI000F62F5FE|nr:glycosyltransferase family 2 protein [Flavobacteriaceae bacterium 14752]
MTENPLVSIIIPTYNRAHLIGETLDSVLAQTYQNWECIIVDDGSSDHTHEVVGAYVKKDYRFKYYHRPDEHLPGGNGARNYGFKMSQGNYVNWLDSDDLFSENKIEEQVKLIKNKTYTVSTCKWGRFEDKDDFKLKNLEVYKDYKPAYLLLKDYGEKGMFFPPHSFLVEKSLIIKSGLWNENLKINQDGEFFCRVIINTEEVVFSSLSYILYRSNSNNKTSDLVSEIKAKHAIVSWRLIEDQLKIIEDDFSAYIEKGKFYIYNKIAKDYKSLIDENPCFFKEQKRFYSIKSRLLRKLNKLFS